MWGMECRSGPFRSTMGGESHGGREVWSDLTRVWWLRLGRKPCPRKPTRVENCLQGTVSRTELRAATYQGLRGTILTHRV